MIYDDDHEPAFRFVSSVLVIVGASAAVTVAGLIGALARWAF